MESSWMLASAYKPRQKWPRGPFICRRGDVSSMRRITIYLLLACIVTCAMPRANAAIAPAAAFITVTSPTGADDWMVSTSHLITWTSTGVTNVTIDYTANNVSYYIIAKNMVNAGSWNWTVSQLMAAGYYNIYIYDPANTAIHGYSASFHVSPFSVSYTPPDITPAATLSPMDYLVIVAIAGLVLVVVAIGIDVKKSKAKKSAAPAPRGVKPSDPLGILQERLARGEITDEEYAAKKALLGNM